MSRDRASLIVPAGDNFDPLLDCQLPHGQPLLEILNATPYLLLLGFLSWIKRLYIFFFPLRSDHSGINGWHIPLNRELLFIIAVEDLHFGAVILSPFSWSFLLIQIVVSFPTGKALSESITHIILLTKLF